jgi:hypothetical protein
MKKVKLPQKSKWVFVLCFLMISITNSFADQCSYVSYSTASVALKYLKNGMLIYGFCSPCGDRSATPIIIQDVRISQPSSEYYQISINGEGIDLANIYVPILGSYRNLAAMARCPVSNVPEYLSELPSVSVPAPAPTPKGHHVYVQPFKVDKSGRLKDTLERVYEMYYLMLKALFIFKDFNIYFKYCGQVQAFSTPQGDIIICNEYVAKLVNERHEKALPWIFFHEVGHSLLHLWDYPLWDNEDAADEFATVIQLMSGNIGKQIISDTIKEWKTHDSFWTSIFKLFVDDRHSTPIQRARNIANWVKDSENLKRRWFKILVPNMQTKVLKGTLQNPEPWVDTELIEKELQRR